MLAVIKENKEIIAACEWCRCNATGDRDKEGKFVWISELEVAEKHRFEKAISKVILEIDRQLDDEVCFVYFCRAKYAKRIRVYPRMMLVDYARREKCLV